MGGKKRSSSSIDVSTIESDAVDDAMVVENPLKQSEKEDAAVAKSDAVDGRTSMERRKKRRAMDKEKHRAESEKKDKSSKAADVVGEAAAAAAVVREVVVTASGPGLHVNVFRDLASADSSVREAAAEALVKELCEVQRVYAKQKKKGVSDGVVPLEAEKDDGLEECAPSVRYAIRRLIRGASSSRECARQGFALGLAAVCATIPSIRMDSVMKLIVDLLEVSSSMRGQEAKDCLLGRLFAYGSLARSGRISMNSDTSLVKNFVADVVTLATKKRYLREPVVSVILEVVDKAPSDALLTEILAAPGLDEWFERACIDENPDALFLALKLQEKFNGDVKHFGRLLPCPFNVDNFFSRDHLSLLAPCFKESAFCLPRVHSLWQSVIDLLTSDMTNKNEDATTRSASSKKQKKNKKGSSFENLCKSIRNFQDVIIEESLFLSSHDRKHLALSILLLVLPRLPESCIHIILSNRLVHGLMDILSNKSSVLYNQSQLFLKELVNLVGDEHRIAVIISLQKHSSGKFDSITRTQFVKQLVAKFNTVSGCLLFVQKLMSLFVNEIAISDEPSDQSQTTDENSELESPEDKASPASGSTDFLKQWVIDTMPRCLKNLKFDADVKTGAQAEASKNLESKFRVQTEIFKFLAVQGVFSASLGTEITSFELQEKFKWPKTATSSSLCRMCIEQLQWLIEDAQKTENLPVLSGAEHNDLGYYFMCFLNTLCNIPSVSLFRTLSSEDEKAFKKLLAMESRLYQEERKIGLGNDASKIHALRYLLIQLLLQVLLHPGEFSEAALEIVICCKKAFPAVAHVDSSDDEECDGGDDMPELMDVLVDNLLSLLPQSSAPLCFSIEQVFRFFCEDITDAGLLQMLRIVKKDLKPPRHQVAMEDKDASDDEEEDFLGIEEADETDEVETADSAGSDNPADESEEISDAEDTDGETTHQVVTTEGGVEEPVEIDKDDAGDNDNTSASDDSASDMDDDAMFRMDSYIAQIFKERKLSGSDSAMSQLIPFKLRVLSLLELYLQKNSGKPQVLMVYSYLKQAFVNSLTAERSEQLRQRIGAILQKRLFKSKDYPKGESIDLSNMQVLLEKSLRLVSRSRFKEAASLAQASTFWLLKIVHSRNFSDSQLEGVGCIFQKILDDYFTNKKSRLKLGFVKEIVRRNTWIGTMLLGFLLEKCGSAKSEFRRIETLDVIDCIIKSCILIGREAKDESSSSKLLKAHLSSLAKLIEELLSNFPEKQARRSQVRKFCTWILQLVSSHNLRKPFLKALSADAITLCELELGDKFTSFQESS